MVMFFCAVKTVQKKLHSLKIIPAKESNKRCITWIFKEKNNNFGFKIISQHWNDSG